ncbi:MAG: hypothetical protein K2X49_23775 [Acetobacteraceae bacterium]|nr:hypothetical protein [Acetobacteraceae bacterium]
MREQLDQRFTDMGEAIMDLSTTAQQTLAEEAVNRCDFPAGLDRIAGLQRAGFAASSIRFGVERPLRERRNADAIRANIEREERRRSEVDAASHRYLTCVLNVARELALTSDESAPVIVDAARGSCPDEAAALTRADWRMKAELDAQARPALIARVLRARGPSGR